MPDKVGDIEVDPRVEWAMKVMDTEGYEFQSEMDKLMAPVGVGLSPAFLIGFSNLISRVPLKTNAIVSAGLFPFGFYAGILLMRWRDNINRENMATMKHYILTHPERFPEPKRTKYIDLIQPYQAYRL